MTGWFIITALLRLGITAIVVWKLTVHRDLFIPSERIGLGLAGGASLLTIPSFATGLESPFEGWAVTLFSAGFFIYLCGRTSRHFRHRARNEEMKRQARQHRGSR